MKTENINQFYKRINLEDETDHSANKQNGYFNVFTRGLCIYPDPIKHHDFYKISLLIGEGILHYSNRSIHINSPAILVSNPLIPYAWEPLSERQEGYFCIFTEDFIRKEERQTNLGQSPLFRVGDDKVFFLEDTALKEIEDIYKKMLEEIQSSHIQKWDILRTYAHLILYKMMKMQASKDYTTEYNSSERIVSLFMTLLDKRFSLNGIIDDTGLKTANDYADQLSIHANHLNRIVKQTTGKTTTAHIAERTIKEAQSLLQNTNLTVSEIAYQLGFEYPSYFSKFFKKHTGKAPSEAIV